MDPLLLVVSMENCIFKVNYQHSKIIPKWQNKASFQHLLLQHLDSS